MIAVGCRPDVITCDTLIGGLCKTGKISVVIKLLEEMVNGNKESGVICRPDVVVYTTIIDRLCKVGLVERARQLFLEHMIQRVVVPDIYTYNILMNSYCLADRIGDAKSKVKDARNLVGEMRLNDVFPDSWTYNVFINRLCKNGYVLEAVEMFNALVNNKFAVSIEVLNSLIDGLCKTKRLGTAWDLFQKFSLHGNLVPDIVTYSILINGLCKNGQLEMENELLS
ncbi:pentatricopeptide repeat-containing protein At1g62680, mitochondrial-like [Pistacia vera]|uniref:pentatricopeptide repeat-containing protein At1g62680, mitochondrial-like n=1 Tax=Pistacia vera TaxID=55513 RepID=UPI0012636409|nr:pentatricopeptide repeat-containing protein At1g62680, mitochondrial-like [Pistacia vera]